MRQHRTKQAKAKGDQLRLFVFKSEFLKIFLDLQTAFAAETRRAEGHWLEEQQKMIKLITL
jgi:hypothetical protein